MKRLKLVGVFMLIAMVSLCLPSCSTLSTSSQSTNQNLEAACLTVGASVQILSIAKANGKLTSAQEKTITDAIAVTEPVCTSPKPPTLAESEAITFEAATNLLLQSAAPFRDQ